MREKKTSRLVVIVSACVLIAAIAYTSYTKKKVESLQPKVHFSVLSGSYDQDALYETYSSIYIGEHSTSNRNLTVVDTILGKAYKISHIEGKLSVSWSVKSTIVATGEENLRFFYAALPTEEVIDFQGSPYDIYHLLIILGKMSFKGKPGYQVDGESEPYIDRFDRHEKYRTGRDNAVYIALIKDKNSEHIVLKDIKDWIKIPAVELSANQMSSMSCIDINIDGCKPYLHKNSPDLTAEQQQYVIEHRVDKSDFQAIIDRLNAIPTNPWK